MLSKEEMHDENKKLLIETATNVKWIKETMEKDSAIQRLFNTEVSKTIDSVKSRVWAISGGLIVVQGVIALFLEFHK